MVGAIVGERRYPCCGRRLRIDFGPDEAALRRCGACRQRWKVALVAAETAERYGLPIWRLEFVAVEARGGGTGGCRGGRDNRAGRDAIGV